MATTPSEEPAKPAQPAPEAEDKAGARKDVTLADVLADPDLARELRAHTEAVLKKATETRDKKVARDAELADMKESERYKSLHEESEAKLKVLGSKHTRLELEAGFNKALVAADVRLADPSVIEFLQVKALEVLEDEGLEMSTAVADTLKKFSGLLKKASADPVPVEEVKPEPTTTPTVPKQTEAPAVTTPSAGVDVLELSPQEYKKYRRDKHDLH